MINYLLELVPLREKYEEIHFLHKLFLHKFAHLKLPNACSFFQYFPPSVSIEQKDQTTSFHTAPYSSRYMCKSYKCSEYM